MGLFGQPLYLAPNENNVVEDDEILQTPLVVILSKDLPH
jgi:hypothetical protein